MTADAAATPSIDEIVKATTKVSGERRGASWRVHVALVVLMIVWLVPTIGLFVNSFRPAQAVATTGWWNGLLPPWNVSLDNYAHVL